MDKADKKKEQLSHNEEIVFFGASRLNKDMPKKRKDFQQDAQKHSYLWLYDEED